MIKFFHELSLNLITLQTYSDIFPVKLGKPKQRRIQWRLSWTNPNTSEIGRLSVHPQCRDERFTSHTGSTFLWSEHYQENRHELSARSIHFDIQFWPGLCASGGNRFQNAIRNCLNMSALEFLLAFSLQKITFRSDEFESLCTFYCPSSDQKNQIQNRVLNKLNVIEMTFKSFGPL